jgi:hypothetical protein
VSEHKHWERALTNEGLMRQHDVPMGVVMALADIMLSLASIADSLETLASRESLDVAVSYRAPLGYPL